MVNSITRVVYLMELVYGNLLDLDMDICLRQMVIIIPFLSCLVRNFLLQKNDEGSWKNSNHQI